MRIALDAMGTDERPVPDVAGGVLAAKEFGDTILLVGDETRIKAELAKLDTNGLKLEIVPAAEEVLMDDKPGVVIKGKPQSSMHVAMNLVAANDADAFVTMGNTGAAHSIATLKTLKRISGVKRPALSSIFSIAGRTFILLDIGANTDSRPEWMAQFAVMGKIYAENALGVKNARVALLSNGEEEGKGNQLIRDAGELIAQLPLNFIGNIEPKAILDGGADVIVSDGFVGNIVVKAFEATTRSLLYLIRDELTRTVFTKAVGALARPALMRVRKQVDPFEIGGAPLLGVNGVVIIGHGRSNAYAVKNAIGQARRAVAGHIIDSIREGLEPTLDLASSAENSAT